MKSLTIIATLTIALLAFSCAPQSDGNNQAAKGASQSVNAVSLTTLAGQWLVSEINGRPFPQDQYPINITISDDKIHATSQCIWWHWSYTMTKPNGFSIEKFPFLKSYDPNEDPITPPMCARGLTIYERNFEEALNKGQYFDVTDNAVTVRGASNSVKIMRRPGLSGSWQVSRIGGTPMSVSDRPILVDIENDVLSAHSQCIPWKWRLRMIDDHSIETTRIEDDIAACERSRSSAEMSFERFMESSNEWKKINNNVIIFKGEMGEVRMEIII